MIGEQGIILPENIKNFQDYFQILNSDCLSLDSSKQNIDIYLVQFEENIANYCEITHFELDFQQCNQIYNVKINPVVIQDGDLKYDVIYFNQLQYVGIYECEFYENDLSIDSKSNGLIQIYQSTEINVDNSQFKNNVAYYGSININQGNQFSIKNSNFTKNSAYQGTGIYLKMTPNFEISKNNFNDNIASNHGGALYITGNYILEDLNILINNNTFSNNQGNKGGAVYLSNIQTCNSCLVTNNIVKENSSNNYGGGGIYCGSSDFITFENNTYSQNSAYYIYNFFYGGGLIIEVVQNIDLINEYFYSNKGNGSGAMMIYLGVYVNVYNVTFKDNWAASGPGTIGLYSSNNIYFTESTFDGNYAPQKSCIQGSKAQFLYIDKCNFINNIAVTQQGALTFGSSSFGELTNSYFYNNTALIAGDVYVQEFDNMLIENNTFTSSSAIQSGGSIMLNNAEHVIIKNITIIGSQASQGGAIFASIVDFLEIYNVVIKSCQGIKSGGAIYFYLINDVLVQNLTVNESLIEQGIGGAIYFEQGENVTFNQITANSNIAYQSGGIQFVDLKEFILNNTEIKQNIVYNSFGGLYLNSITDANIENIVVEDNISQFQIGGVQITQCINMVWKNANISNNQAQYIAGIQINEKTDELYFYDLLVESNMANGLYGGININFAKNIYFKDSQIVKNAGNQQGENFYILEAEFISIESTFICQQEDQNSADIDSLYGGLLMADSVDNLQITNGTFLNGRSQMYGGGLYILDTDKIDIQKSYFENNKLTDKQSQGGSIYAANIIELIIQDTQFIDNYAYFEGGALYLKEIETFKIESSFLNENIVKFQDDSYLYEKDQNYVLSKGGSIYYQAQNLNKSYKIVMKNIQIDKSVASSGGAIFMLSEQDVEISFNFSDLLIQYCKADFGNALRYLGDQQSDIKNLNDKFTINQGGNYIGNEDITSGYQNNEYQVSQNSYSFNLCQSQKYLIVGKSKTCQSCPNDSKCEGGYIPIYPKEGYWRDINGQLDETVSCGISSQNFCKGNDTCEEGYYGMKCDMCDNLNDYQIKGTKCAKCSSLPYITLNFILNGFFSLLVLGYQVYAVKKRVNRRLMQNAMNRIFNYASIKLPLVTGITKIIITHVQIYQITSEGLGINLPKSSLQVINIFGYPQELFSEDIACLFKIKDENQLKLFSYKISIYAIFISFQAVLFLWLIIYILYKKRIYIKSKLDLNATIKSSLLCFFLYVQPGLIKFGLSFIICQNVLDVKYTAIDSNLLCSDDEYRFLVLPLNLIIFLLISIVLPGLIFYKLRQAVKSGEIQKIKFQKVYCIMYLEYKQKSYFWEIIIMSIKCVLIIIQLLLLDSQYLEIRIIMYILVLYLLLMVSSKINPFINQITNRLYVISIQVQICTLALLLAIQSFTYESSPVFYALFIIILGIANFYFFAKCAQNVIKEFYIEYRVRVLLILKSQNVLIWLQNFIHNKIELTKKSNQSLRFIKLRFLEYAKQKKSNFLNITKPKSFSQHLQHSINKKSQIFSVQSSLKRTGVESTLQNQMN